MKTDITYTNVQGIVACGLVWQSATGEVILRKENTGFWTFFCGQAKSEDSDLLKHTLERKLQENQMTLNPRNFGNPAFRFNCELVDPKVYVGASTWAGNRFLPRPWEYGGSVRINTVFMLHEMTGTFIEDTDGAGEFDYLSRILARGENARSPNRKDVPLEFVQVALMEKRLLIERLVANGVNKGCQTDLVDLRHKLNNLKVKPAKMDRLTHAIGRDYYSPIAAVQPASTRATQAA